MVKEIKPDNLIISTNVNLVKKGVKLAPGTYKRGSAIGFVTDTYNLIGESTFTVDKIEGILAEDITVKSDEMAIIYLTGQFNADSIIVKSGTQVKDLIAPARKLGIFIF